MKRDNAKNASFDSAVWYTISNVIAKGISLLLTPIFARMLTMNEYGVYTSFVSWQNILVTFFSLELSSTILRARFDYENDDEFSGYVFTITFFSVTFSSISILIISACFKFDMAPLLGLDNAHIRLLYATIIFSPLLQLFQAEQRAQIKYKKSSIITVLYGISSFLLPYLFMRIMEDDLTALLVGITMNIVIWGGGIFLYFWIRNEKKISRGYIFYALTIALPIVPHLLSNIIMGNSDKLMINNMCGPEVAALYGVVYTCSLAVTLLRNSLNSAWVPWFYKKMKDHELRTIKNISNAYMYLFSIGAFILCLTGPEVILILGGPKYSAAANLMPAIMLGCFYNFMNLFYVNIEFYEKKTFMISVITVFTAILNIGSNYIGIKRFGYSAAAYTTAFCNLLIVILHYFTTRKMGNKEVCDNPKIFMLCILAFIATLVCKAMYNYVVLRLCMVLFISFGFLYKIRHTELRSV